MTSRTFIVSALTAALLSWLVPGTVPADEKLPAKSAKACLKCHKYDKMPGVFAGLLVGVSKKAKTIQLRVGKDMEVVYYGDATDLQNASTMKKIKKNQATKIVYYRKGGKNFAKTVVVKKGLDVPKDKLASVEEVADLVAQGPEKGKYVLIDSRPFARFNEGHIPTAKAIPFFAFDKLKGKVLPKDKSIRQIYYCGGFT